MNIDWEEIKGRHPIEDVLERRGVKLTRSGTGFLCKCPLHNEHKGTAFSVDPHKQLWSCFGKCQTGGDVIKLVMLWDSVDTVTAAEILEGRKLADDPALPRVKRERPVRPVEIPVMRELPSIPKLYAGELRHWQALADLRKLPNHYGVELAVRNGVIRFCLAYEKPAWAVLDVSEPCNVQVRRLDGQMWFGGERKVMGIKHNWARWPVGLTVALRNPQAEIMLVEGTGDFLAAYHLASEAVTNAIPLAMFGASNPIHDGALAFLCGRAVHIIEQHDEAGAVATERWHEQLTASGCRVRVSKVPTEGEDLNDHISAGRDLGMFE